MMLPDFQDLAEWKNREIAEDARGISWQYLGGR
jgi:hypothetical protein